jgi:hypothetical protein
LFLRRLSFGWLFLAQRLRSSCNCFLMVFDPFRQGAFGTLARQSRNEILNQREIFGYVFCLYLSFLLSLFGCYLCSLFGCLRIFSLFA